MKYDNYSANYSENYSAAKYPKKYKDNKILCICVSVLLLALVCVGAAELAFARVAAPELYHQVTDPVVSAVQTGYAKAADAAKGAAEALGQAASAVSVRIAEATAAEAALEQPAVEEAQLADETIPLSELPAADPIITAAYNQEQFTYLTGGSIEMIYFNQKSAEWADKPYGTDDLGRYGCGPTAMAMIVSSLRQETVDPAQMAEFCYQSGYWCKGQGSYLSIVNGVADAYSLKCTPLAPNQLDKETLLSQLAGGDMAVALMHKGHFTTGGHFIVLRGVTLEGQVLVADPNSLERSLVPWDPEIILDELSYSRASGAPLWLLSTN